MPKFAVSIKRTEKYEKTFSIEARNKTEARRKAEEAFDNDHSGYLYEKLTECFDDASTSFKVLGEIPKEKACLFNEID